MSLFNISKNISSHLNWFTTYAAHKISMVDNDTFPLKIKNKHSLHVFDTTRHIIHAENFSPILSIACLLAALYHDIGRFDQYIKFHTFNDNDSCNHGLLGVRILKRENRLAMESKSIQKLVLTAVGMHNRYELPRNIPITVATVTNVVRDADKLDILRIVHENLQTHGPYNSTLVRSLQDDQNLLGPKVLAAVREKRVPAYSDLRCLNDFRLLLATWFYDLHFNSSRSQFLEERHAEEMLRDIPDNTPQSGMRDLMLQRFKDYGERPLVMTDSIRL